MRSAVIQQLRGLELHADNDDLLLVCTLVFVQQKRR